MPDAPKPPARRPWREIAGLHFDAVSGNPNFST